MSIFKCKDCPYDKEINSIEVSLIDANHICAFHKLEVCEMFYYLGKKVSVSDIKNQDGKIMHVLTIED